MGAAPGHFAAPFPASGAASAVAAVRDTLSDRGRDRARQDATGNTETSESVHNMILNHTQLIK